MWLTVIRVEVPIMRVIIFLRTQRGGDGEAISFYRTIRSGMVGCGGFILDGHGTTTVLTERRDEASFVIRYAFLQRTIVKHPPVREVLGYFCG